MTEFEQRIHDIVKFGQHPMNSNQIFQALLDVGEVTTIDEVRRAIARLEGAGFLKDANLSSYFASG